MFPKVIKTETEYDAALARINELMDALPGTSEGDELELLVALVEMYERQHYPIGPPSPIEAVRFRMEQLNLKQKDLLPYIGSRGKVSEILSGRRTLSLPMIRKLHAGLGIPAHVLLQEPDVSYSVSPERIEWPKFPLAEMLRRQWLPDFHGTLAKAKQQAEELLRNWASPLDHAILQPALLRQHVRAGSESDAYALAAWRVRVSLLALQQSLPPYNPSMITQDFARDLVRLSYLDNGPQLAREFLHKNGIHLVVESHLPHTHLDGAAIKLPDGSPLVAMTLRHNRLDNFWFTLCHELAHVALHLDKEDYEAFFDDLDQAEITACEKDADHWAAEALIPSGSWQAAEMGRTPSAQKIIDFSSSLRISPAIPAGRVRREQRNYKLFSKLVGYNKVQKFFLG